MHRTLLIGIHSAKMNTVQWPGAVPEQRGHLLAFASQWRSRSTASGPDLLRKMEPQNILEGLWKKHDKKGYFSLCFLHLPSCCSAVSPAQSGCPRAASGGGCRCPVWGLGRGASTALRTLVRNCASHVGVQKHESNRCQNMTFPLGTRHFL